MKIILEHERACLLHGDSAQLGDVLPENSIDAIVSDPPCGISFMGKTWDDDKGGRDLWSQWLADLLAPAFRALKPGGHCLLWSLPRTSHWTARALELAGFELRDVVHDIAAADDVLQAFAASLSPEQRTALARAVESQTSPILCQIFGSGFPKNKNISKAIDQHYGKSDERPVIGHAEEACGVFAHSGGGTPQDITKYASRDITGPATPEASRWTGWGSALKPAIEHWILARKPLEGTYAANILTHGTGALNIDGCRIGSCERPVMVRTSTVVAVTSMSGVSTSATSSGETTTLGRWPAHLTLAHAPGCRELGTVVETSAVYANAGDTDRDGNGTNFAMGVQRVAGAKTFAHARYECAPGCPVAELDAQSGERKSGARAAGVRQGRRNGKTYGDQLGDGGPAIAPSKGGASRFFYCSKAPRSEKDAGLGHLEPKTGGEATGRVDDSAGTKNPRAGAGRTGGARNFHPTTKSIALMTWLIKLVTPPGGTILDPFAGSGTTGVAALANGFNFIGSEQGGPDNEYLPILLGRLKHALGESE